MGPNGSSKETQEQKLWPCGLHNCAHEIWDKINTRGAEVSSQRQRQVCSRSVQNSLWSKMVCLFIYSSGFLICSSMSLLLRSWRTVGKGRSQTDSSQRRRPVQTMAFWVWESGGLPDLLERWLLMCNHNHDVCSEVAGLYWHLEQPQVQRVIQVFLRSQVLTLIIFIMTVFLISFISMGQA